MTLKHVLQVLATVACVVVSLLLGSVAVEASPPPTSLALTISTIPAAAGAIFRLDDQVETTNAAGVVVFATPSFRALGTRLTFLQAPDQSFEFVRFTKIHKTSATSGDVGAQFAVSAKVSFSFVDLANKPVASRNVESMKLKNSLGVEYVVTTADIDSPLELPAARVVPGPEGSESKLIYYTVQEVIVRGTNIVNRSQQKFYPIEVKNVAVTTQFFAVTVQARDALFGYTTGSAVLMVWPDGGTSKHPIVNGEVHLPLLPRGEYQMRLDGAGLVTWRPVSVSRDQTIELRLMSAVDISSLVFVALAIAVAALLVGRRNKRTHRRRVAAASSAGDGRSGVK